MKQNVEVDAAKKEVAKSLAAISDKEKEVGALKKQIAELEKGERMAEPFVRSRSDVMVFMEKWTAKQLVGHGCALHYLERNRILTSS